MSEFLKALFSTITLCLSTHHFAFCQSLNNEQKLAENREVLELIELSTELEQVSLDSSLKMSTLALEKAKQLRSDSLIGKVLLAMSTQLIKKGKNGEAQRAIREALSYYKKTGNPEYIHTAYYQLGYFHYYEKQFDSSLYYFTKVRNFHEENGNLSAMAAAEVGIGTHYYYYKKDYDQALEHYRSAANAYNKLMKPEGESGSYLFIGLALLKKQMADSAAYYFNRSYEIAHAAKLPAKELEALSYQASVLLLKNDSSQAFQKTVQALHLARQLGIRQQEARLSSSIVDIILSDSSTTPPGYAVEFLKEEGGLENFLRNTEEFAFAYGIPHTRLNLLEYLSLYYEKEQEYATALRYHKRLKAFSDSIRDRTKDLTIAEVEEKYETAEREKELIRKQAEVTLLKEQKRQNIERFSGFMIFLLLILASAVLYARLKAARAREAKKGKELAETTLEKELAEKELTRQSLKMKERELAAQTLTLLRKEEMLEEVQTKLEAAKSYDDIRSVKRSIQLNKLKNTDWEKFLMSFNNLHPTFNKYLDEASRSSSITQRERRLAALLRLGLSNREISIMLGINSASVDQAKYRLKKKLSLDVHQKLEEYLSGID